MSVADDFDSTPTESPPGDMNVTVRGVARPESIADDFNSTPVMASKKIDASQSTALGSDMQNFMAGAGKAAVDLGRGAKQLSDIPAKWLEGMADKYMPGLNQWAQEQGFPSAQASSAATNADVAESRRLDAPLMSTKAGIAGNIAGTLAGTMVPLGAAAAVPNSIRGGTLAAAALNPSSYGAAIASGAVQGALQPVTGDESHLFNAAVGGAAGAAGNAVVNTIGRVAQPVANVLSTAHDKAVSVLEDAGIPLDAAQKSGSAFLSKLRSSFWDNPFTAGSEASLAAAQRSGYNQAVLKTIGEDATAATPEVMQAAQKRINGVFSDVLGRNSVGLSDDTVSRIGAIQQAALDDEKTPVANMANRIIGAVGHDDTIPGQTAYAIKKDLDRLSSSPDSTLAYHARQLRSTFLDAVGDSLTPADNEALTTARQQFANMKTIEPAIDRLGNGDISPSKLANVMAQKANRQKSVYGYGDQDLVDLAHSGNMLLPDRTPNSGTATRALMQMAAPLAIGGAQGAYSGDWESGLKTAAAVAIAPKAAQFLLNNPATSDYLARGMTGAMAPVRQLLELPQTNAAVGGALRRLPGAAVGQK